MTRTASTKVVSLSNTKSQNFKSELPKITVLSNTQSGKTDLIKTSDGLFNCSLKLPNGTSMIIPMREDGMINATMLCKAHGKKLLSNYNRNKETKEYLEELSINMRISILELFVTNVGGNHSGTWVHRKVAIHLAQWLSPSFAVQVSNWLDELFITGSVTLGQEKSNKELEEKFNEKIQSLQKTIETVVNENLKIKSTYSHLAELHDQIRMKRNYHKFKKGNCLYIITDRWREKDYLKIGYTDNINTRLQTYRTSMPDVKIEFLLYLTENKFLEKCLKVRYASQLVQKNHEYVIDATIEQLVKSINSLTKYLRIEATEETKLSLYNEPYKIYNLIFLDQNDKVKHDTDPIDLDLSDQKKNNLLFLDQNGNIEDDTDPTELDSPDEKKNNNEPKHECNTETEHDSDSEVYKCDICGTEYKTKGNFLNHMIKVHNQTDKKDDEKTCLICKKVFENSSKRNRHVRCVHKKLKVKCTKCDKDFSSNDALMNHIRLVHEKSQQCECAQCGTVCSNTGNLRKHIEQMHDKTTSVSCHICGNEFMSQGNLNQHILKVHQRTEKCNCEICGKELLSLLGLEYHMRNFHKI